MRVTENLNSVITAKNSPTASAEVSIEDLIKQVIIKLAKKENIGRDKPYKSINEYMKGYSISDVVAVIDQVGAGSSEQELTIAVRLVRNHGEKIVEKYQGTENEIGTENLFYTLKVNPNKSMAESAALTIARKNGMYRYQAAVFNNLKIRFVSAEDIVQKVNKAEAEFIEEMYQNTNEAEEVLLAKKLEDNQKDKERAKKENYRRLANMELEQRLGMVDKTELTRAKLEEALENDRQKA